MSGQVVVGDRSSQRQTGPELMAIANSSVVRLSVELGGEEIGHGSAFAYKQIQNGSISKIYFITNLHNFSKSLGVFNLILSRAAAGASDEQLTVKTYVGFLGSKHEVTDIIAMKGALFARGYPRHADFAIFSLECELSEQLKLFALPNPEDAQAGETVYAFGFPHITDLGITEGIVSHVYGEQAKPDLQWQIQHSMLINPGNSGGPTVTPQGVAVGISTWGYTNVDGINFSVNVQHALSLCQDKELIEEVSISGVFERFVKKAREEVKFGS